VSFGFDEELPRGFQDADFEMRELEAAARASRRKTTPAPAQPMPAAQPTPAPQPAQPSPVAAPGRVAITGNTYPVKEQLKALGATWNKAQGAWMMPAEHAEQARQIVAGAGPVQRRPYRGRSRYQSNYTRFSSGAEHYQNKRGRCEDAPCCGCCS